MFGTLVTADNPLEIPQRRARLMPILRRFDNGLVYEDKNMRVGKKGVIEIFKCV
jgi:hypothetical protein